MWRDSHENKLALAANIAMLPLMPLVVLMFASMAILPVFVVGYIVYHYASRL